MPPSRGAPEGPQKRKKDRGTTFYLGDLGAFPHLPDVFQENEEYLIIKSMDPERPMMSYNQFVVKKEITRITKKWSKFGRTREGHLILKISGEKDIEELKKLKTIGQWKVEVQKDEYLNTVKGVIYCRDLIYLSDQEIKEALNGWCIEANKKFRIKEVYSPRRIPINRGGKRSNTHEKNTNSQGENEKSSGVRSLVTPI